MSRNKRRQHRRDQPAESRAAEVTTVIWMVSVMTTLVCGFVAGAMLLAAGNRAGTEGAQLFGRLLHFSAFVSAILSLVLLAVVLKVRVEAPPKTVTWFAVALALLVICAALLY